MADGPPDIPPPKGGTAEQLVFTLNRLYDLLSAVMQESVNDRCIAEVEVLVRLCLTEYSTFSSKLYSERKERSLAFQI
jgi:hypothetical protein